MGQAHLGHRIGHAVRLVRIQRVGQSGAHVAEGAGAGAGVAHDHERRVLLLPALADVRAARLLAHRHQLVVAHQLAGLLVFQGNRRLDAQPVRLLPLHRVVRLVRLFRMPRLSLLASDGVENGGQFSDS